MDDHTQIVLGFMLLPVALGNSPKMFYHIDDEVSL